MNTSICCYLCTVYTNNAVYQLVNQYDTLKQGAWVVTGIKKDGSEAMRLTLMLYVNESGFYALVLGSKLSTAVKFKNWVTADTSSDKPFILILPSIKPNATIRKSEK